MILLYFKQLRIYMNLICWACIIHIVFIAIVVVPVYIVIPIVWLRFRRQKNSLSLSLSSCRVQTKILNFLPSPPFKKLTIFQRAQSKIVANRSQKALVKLRNQIKFYCEILLLRTKSKYTYILHYTNIYHIYIYIYV